MIQSFSSSSSSLLSSSSSSSSSSSLLSSFPFHTLSVANWIGIDLRYERIFQAWEKLIMMSIKKKIMINIINSKKLNVENKIKNLEKNKGDLFDRVLLVCGDINNLALPSSCVSLFFIIYPQPPKSLSFPSYFINKSLLRDCYIHLINNGEIFILTICCFGFVDIYILCSLIVY
jgi:hypothetical protein